ncbi:hypothetical protein NDU88_006263 [Pleurodeles waltl]|uniref:Uncharacterized protein n=1 Tax=Pleurodeles waltl TaxID=8319 RepID=A0AAV7RMK2_PLEWA|nr:hypothetical protein NDU88_006263 [Pleurodeles waltl]
MPGGRSSHKNTGKPARQLLFSEALLQAKGVPPPTATQPSTTHQEMADPAPESTMDRFPENIEGEDLHRFLRDTLPRLTGTTLEPPTENRYGRSPRPIIACLLRHTHARPLIQKARTQGPCQLDGHTIRISADFCKETSGRRRAFLALRPRQRQLEVKYGLFDPARMWIAKNGASEDFYDPEDLRSFLDGLSLTDSFTSTPHRDTTAADQNTPSHDLVPGGSGSAHQLPLPCPRGQDLERLLHSHGDRGQVVHAVALHMQVADRDKSCSPLKPLAEPT